MALIEELEKQGNWLFRYRSYLPLFILVVGVGVLLLQFYLASPIFAFIWEHWHAFTYASLFVGLVGLTIRVFTVGHTPANTSGRNTSEGQVADEVNMTGIYSTVRHPLYLGNYLMWLAVAMMTGSLSFLVIFSLVYWIYYERIMLAEEQFLIGKFGDAYSQWAAVTPAFIPSLNHYCSPQYPFSWKKVLKKEKNGLLALLLLLTLFDVIACGINGWSRSVNVVMIVLTMAGLVAYLVLKVLKKKHLLDEQGR